MFTNGRKVTLTGFGTGFPEALQSDLQLSWRYTAGIQHAFTVRVEGREGVVWSTGRIESNCTWGIVCPRSIMNEDSPYRANVKLFMEDGEELESDPLFFWTGIPSEHWRSEWLKPYNLEETHHSAPLFRKKLKIDIIPETARLYICGLGYFQARINGAQIGDDLLGPGWMVYRKHVPYFVYNITEYLKEGENVLGVVLGEGWYKASLLHQVDTMTFSLLISLTYPDGTKKWMMTGRRHDWQVYSGGPIVRNSIYDGEIYDARREVPGWDTTLFQPEKASGWMKAIVTEGPEGEMIPQMAEPIRIIKTLSPIAITKKGDTRYIIDFGQNIAGFARITLHEPEGKEIRFSFAEIVDQDGFLNKANLRTAKAEDLYISSGKQEVYQPIFTYHGFRYLEISGLTDAASLDTLQACIIRNDVKERGGFSCGNDLINRIENLCVWTENNNLHWVPTDCPQRDERLGWLNDLTVRAEEAVFHFELHSLLAGYLQIIADEQGKKTGAITDTAPHIRFGSQPADPVCSSFLILGWLLYQHYGDTETLKRYYSNYAAWTEYLWSISDDGIVPYSYYGDWASPAEQCDSESYGAGAVSITTPGTLMSSGYLYYNALLMTKMAEILEKQDDVRHWKELQSKIACTINNTFYHPETCNYATGSQAANTFMMWLGIAPDPEKTAAQLRASVAEREYHLTTGNLCSRYILEVLTEAGFVNDAFRIATQTSYPSWGYMVEMGATTIWERWEYVDSGPLLGMASHDHPMYAAVSVWFYQYLLGLKPEKPAFDQFLLKPYFPDALPCAEGFLDTVKGRIETGWRHHDGEICISVQVPMGSSCRFVPTCKSVEQIEVNETKTAVDRTGIILEPGFHQIVMKLQGERDV